VLIEATRFRTYTLSQKKVGHFHFRNKFGKRGSIFVIFFTVKFIKDLQRKLKLKHIPSNLLSHYLAKCKWSIAAVNSVQSDANTFFTVNVHEGCCFFVFTYINL